MQAQAVRPEQTQDTLTAAQSLQSIQTLLRAGLGCITYLRNLLPADNFSESYLTSAASDPQPSDSFSSESGPRNVSGFKIMTVTRGFTEEADKLLDYLENGIFDALQKQYLRSFIFAIYLDSEDPNNIVEAYTFNFHYYTMPGSNIPIPVMSLGDDLMKLSISGKKNVNDPVADATRKGKLPTLGEVKRSLKTLIKNLIQATTQMDALPRRRFATFKLFYHDHTPDDYEPPHFRAGDSKKDRWYFTTHDAGEAPEKCSVGRVQTGWHGVDVRVASVSGYLPSAEDNNAPFMGTTVTDGNAIAGPPLTPAEEVETRRQQNEVQVQDALNRRIAWDAEEGLSDLDAEGEIDDGDESQTLGIWKMSAAGMEFVTPMGLIDDDGNLVPLPKEEAVDKDATPTEEALFQGIQEKVPRHVGQLDLPATNSGELTQTQHLDSTQRGSSPAGPPSNSSSPLSSPEPPTPRAEKRSKYFRSESLPPSDPLGLSVPSSASFHDDETVDTQMLKEQIMAHRQMDEDTDMLDTDTQAQPYLLPEEDTIRSFTASKPSVEVVPDSQPDVAMDRTEDDHVNCECGVGVEDCECIFCDSGCHRWYHTWCMGYHSDNIPEKFTCFDCRVHADRNWDLINVHGLHAPMIAKFKDLALFRRAIKIFEQKNPEGLSAFTKAIGCEPLVAGQVFKRLENKGFIMLEGAEIREEETGKQTRSRKGTRSTRKQPARRRTAQKHKYIFNRGIIQDETYQDYFNPDPEVEKRLLGLEELQPKKKTAHKTSEDHIISPPVSQEVPLPEDADSQDFIPSASQVVSQTQEETQFVMETQLEESVDLKRHATSLPDDDKEGERKTKKVKISIGPPVDLGD